jgi:hypothetical protein
MKPQDIFGLIVRSFALYLIVWGAWNTLAGFKYFPATVVSVLNGSSMQYNTFDYWIYGAPALILGLLALRYANAVTRFSYPVPKPENPPQP